MNCDKDAWRYGTYMKEWDLVLFLAEYEENGVEQFNEPKEVGEPDELDFKRIERPVWIWAAPHFPTEFGLSGGFNEEDRVHDHKEHIVIPDDGPQVKWCPIFHHPWPNVEDKGQIHAEKGKEPLRPAANEREIQPSRIGSCWAAKTTTTNINGQALSIEKLSFEDHVKNIMQT